MQLSGCLDGTEDPKDQSLQNSKTCRADAEHEVDTEILADLGVSAGFGVLVGPALQPNAASYTRYSVRHTRARGAKRDA